MNIGQAIRKLRKEKGLTLKQFSALTNISINALSRIERGEAMPKKDTLNVICEVLDTKPNYILFMAIDIEDVKPEKQEIFKLLYEPLCKLLTDK